MGCGGSSGGTDNYARYMRQQSEQQKADFSTGLKQINTAFDGGTYGYGLADKYDPTQTYYNAAGVAYKMDPTNTDFLAWLKKNPKYSLNAQTGSELVNTGGTSKTGTPLQKSVPTFTPSDVASKKAWDAYMQNLQSTHGLFTGTKTTEGYDKAYYDKIYNAYAGPQGDATLALQDQSQNAALQVRNVLSDRGTGNSSIADTMSQGLARSIGDQQNAIVNAGQALVNDRRSAIEQNRTADIQALSQSGNLDQNAANVASAASQFSGMPSWQQPSANMLGSFLQQYLYNQVGNSYGSQGGLSSLMGQRMPTNSVNVPVASYV